MKQFNKRCYLIVLTAILFNSAMAQFGDRGVKMTRAETQCLVDSISNALKRWYIDPVTVKTLEKKLHYLVSSGSTNRSQDRVSLAETLNALIQQTSGDPMLSVKYYPIAAKTLEKRQQSQLSDSADAAGRALALKRAEEEFFGFWGMEIFPGRIGYVRWDRFDGFVNESAPMYDSAFKWLSSCNALVVDMRYNSGGDPDAVLRMQSYFVEQSTPMNHLINNTGDTVKRFADPEMTPFRVTCPVLVLASAQTGGAAEDFIYGLRQAKRLEVAGDTTAGNTYAGRLVSVGQGFVSSIPCEKPVNGQSKTSWLKEGIRPDHPVNTDEAMSKAMMVLCSRLIGKAKTTSERERFKTYLLQAKAGKYNGVAFVNLKNADLRDAVLIRDSIFGPTNVSQGAGMVKDFKINPPYLSESNSAWFKLKFERDTTLTFDIVPINEEDDYDFALFKCNGHDCLQQIISGMVKPERLCHSGFSSYNGATGLSPHGGAGYVGPGPGHTYVQPMRVHAGETFYLLVDFSEDYTNAGKIPRGFMIYFHDYWPEKKPVVLKNVFFNLNSAILTPVSQKQLNKLVAELERNRSLNIEIRGHTDNQGSEDDNLKLSSDRAEAVRAYLVSKGIAANRVISKGYGSSKPLFPNSTETGRQKNRRVEFAIIMK